MPGSSRCITEALHFSHRARQDRLEKKRTTQKFIEEFQKDQALRKRRQHEEMEEENRKIMEFANMWQEREDNRMAKIHENEEKKRKLQQMVLTLLFCPPDLVGWELPKLDFPLACSLQKF